MKTPLFSQSRSGAAVSGNVTEIERFAERGLQAVDPGQARMGKLIARGRIAWGGQRVVGMGLERGNRYMHPLGKRQNAEQTIELVFAVGAVQAEDPGLAGSGAQSPNPDEMPLVHQLGCSGCFRVLTALDLGIRSSVGRL